MSWTSLGNYQLTDQWSFSEFVEGELFRLIHKQITNLPKNSLRGVIAQGFKNSQSKITKFKPSLFTYGEEYEIFPFYFPVGISKHSIILKRLDKYQVDWSIEVQMFKADNPTEDYQNYLISRFGKSAITQFHQSFNMALYPILFSGSTTPESNTIKLVANRPTKLLKSNDSRTQIRIYSTGQSVTLTTGFDESGKPLQILAILPPNYNFEDVITSAGMYKGDVYAISEKETYVTVIEFFAE